MFNIAKTVGGWLLMTAAVAAFPALSGCNHNTPAQSDNTTPQSAQPNSVGASGGSTDSNAGIKPVPDSANTATPGPTAAATANVSIQLFRFKPAQLTVAPGTTVTWTNNDDINHTVTSGTADKPGGPLNGKLATKGATYSYKFETPGEYPYFCDFHNSMTGTISVKQP